MRMNCGPDLIDFEIYMGDTVPPSDIPDAFQKLFLDSEFSLGDEAQTQLEKRHAEIRAKIAALPNPFQKAASASATGAPLEKRAPNPRSRAALREFLKSCVARGEDLAAVVAYAEANDPDTAHEMREIISAEF